MSDKNSVDSVFKTFDQDFMKRQSPNSDKNSEDTVCEDTAFKTA